MSLSLALGMALLSACPAPGDAAIIGTATDPDSGRLHYCEYHYPAAAHPNPQSAPATSAATTRVEYHAPEKGLIALKQLNEEHRDPARPWLHQIDLRGGELRQTEWIDGTLLLSYRPRQHGEIEQTALPAGQVDIVDAGFEHFVQRHWQALLSGSAIPARFASPVHQRSLPLRVRLQPMADCGAPPHPQAAYCLWVEADSLWLRWLLDPIQLQYNHQQQLVRYRGVGNLLTEGGQPMRVNLDYRYCPCDASPGRVSSRGDIEPAAVFD
ncbi:hypothetical protein [Aestuariirhabdus litorea]|uniref:Lipoprotein n=1 Tax=Aestuariirhabdus litorea TaxID=2528527 RepID=A0A3P3VM37_9GAMM|nr:hypothetical protein [Aestuariirhabdus litorea]RRJ83831.1 hypothetical protein D0544_01560 [Aestuariirhabdus litorea]RWW97054.1 hypothetical protein DZC74_01560 [Endozoicomonadaceae bacterium GTF-13]